MALKHYSVPFVICPKWGNEIEGIVLNRVCILGTFCPKQGQGFKLSAAHLDIQVLVEYPQEAGGGGICQAFLPWSWRKGGRVYFQKLYTEGKKELGKGKSQEHENHCVGELGFTFFSWN